MNHQELEGLLVQRDAIADVLQKVNEAILEQQIIREDDMKQLGFHKIKEASRVVIYGRQLKSGAHYEIILNLVVPNLVTLHRVEQDKTYGFEINSLSEFRELLIFGNLL